MPTPSQASCFLSRRPDIKALICPNRPDICGRGDLEVLQYWWTSVLTGPGTADWELKQQVGGSLDAYLERQGCGAGAPAPSPGPQPGPVPGCPAGQIGLPVVGCVEKNTLYLAGGLLVLLMLLDGGGRRRR